MNSRIIISSLSSHCPVCLQQHLHFWGFHRQQTPILRVSSFPPGIFFAFNYPRLGGQRLFLECTCCCGGKYRIILQHLTTKAKQLNISTTFPSQRRRRPGTRRRLLTLRSKCQTGGPQSSPSRRAALGREQNKEKAGENDFTGCCGATRPIGTTR